MKPKIKHTFTCNLENKDFNLVKSSYYSIIEFMKKHIAFNYILKNNNFCSDFIGSIFDEVIEESVLKIFTFGEEEKKARGHEN